MRYVIPAVLALALLLAACAPQQQSPTGEAIDAVDLPPEPEAPTAEEPAEETTPEEPLYTITYTEGDLAQLKPVAIDPDGTEVTYTFTPPVGKDGSWQTSIGDEGAYLITVGASDGESITTETVRVVILRANRAPVIDCGDGVTVKEGERIDLHDSCSITDEDDGEVVVTYGGWMTSWRYETTYDDAGDHVVRITASDKRKNEILHTVTEDVNVRVTDVNRQPEFGDYPASISATENDVITLPATGITDPDGDDVTVTYSAPFDSKGVWRTELGDAGEYEIDVVASDGKTSAKRTVLIAVALRNTAPALKPIWTVTVDEGELIKIPISATDREGDALTVTVTGWMTSDTYQTTYRDAGEYTAKVTVSDGTLSTSAVVEIVVRDVNRPPVFVTPA